MSLISAGDVTGIGAAATGVASIAQTVGDFVERFIPDKEKQAEAAEAMQMLLLKQQGDANQGQLAIDQVEAGSSNWWVAGARPAVMWLCVLIYALNYLFFPLFTALIHIWQPGWSAPALNEAATSDLMYTLLGCGGLHTAAVITGREAPLVPPIPVLKHVIGKVIK